MSLKVLTFRLIFVFKEIYVTKRILENLQNM